MNPWAWLQMRWRVYRAVRQWHRKQSAPCAHVWRVIAAPYVRQCRRCGTVEFREDARGDFPDGLREWIETMTRRTNV